LPMDVGWGKHVAETDFNGFCHGSGCRQ
jgi:hypothetical protein